jgi:hypothetical protein
MQKSQVEMLEMAADRSCSSTPSSIADQYGALNSTSTPSTTFTASTNLRGMTSEDSRRAGGARSGEGFETASTTTSGDCDTRISQRRSHGRLCVAGGGRVGPGSQVASSPCIISRGNLPFIADERRIGAEDETQSESKPSVGNCGTETSDPSAVRTESEGTSLLNDLTSNKSSPRASVYSAVIECAPGRSANAGRGILTGLPEQASDPDVALSSPLSHATSLPASFHSISTEQESMKRDKAVAPEGEARSKKANNSSRASVACTVS